MARQTAGAFAAWSQRVEGDTPGPLAETARVLGRSAQLRAHQGARRALRTDSAGAATRLLAVAVAGGQGAAAQRALMTQLALTVRALHDAHQAAGDLHRANEIRDVVTARLQHVHDALPTAVLSLADVDDGQAQLVGDELAAVVGEPAAARLEAEARARVALLGGVDDRQLAGRVAAGRRALGRLDEDAARRTLAARDLHLRERRGRHPDPVNHEHSVHRVHPQRLRCWTQCRRRKRGGLTTTRYPSWSLLGTILGPSVPSTKPMLAGSWSTSRAGCSTPRSRQI